MLAWFSKKKGNDNKSAKVSALQGSEGSQEPICNEAATTSVSIENTDDVRGNDASINAVVQGSAPPTKKN